MTRKNKIILSIIISAAVTSIIGFVYLHKIYAKHLALDFHHKQHPLSQSDSDPDNKSPKGPYDQCASMANKKLISLLDKPGFLSKCAQEMNNSVSHSSITSDSDISLENLCHGLDKLNRFVIRSKMRRNC